MPNFLKIWKQSGNRFIRIILWTENKKFTKMHESNIFLEIENIFQEVEAPGNDDGPRSRLLRVVEHCRFRRSKAEIP